MQKKQLRLSQSEDVLSFKKQKIDSQFVQESLLQTHRKSIQSYQSDPLSIKTTKGFSEGKSKKTYRRTIQYSNLRLLDKVKDNLINIRQQMMIHLESKEQLESQLNTKLKKTFVIFAKINNIRTQLNKYIIECEDQTCSSMQLTFSSLSNTSLSAQVQFSNKKLEENEKEKNLVSVTDINSLEYEPSQSIGHPYFEFIINLRELPIYSTQFTFMKEKTHDLNTDSENEASFSNNKNKRIIGYQVKPFIESMKQIRNYNLITLCHSKIILQSIYSQNPAYQDLDEDNQIDI